MDARRRSTAERMRSLLASGRATPELFRAGLIEVPPPDRDAWLDRVLALDELPVDSDALPPGCVPYLPCSVDALLCAVDCAEVCPSDVFVDVGAGLGRAVVAAHLLTGAPAIGLEIQPALARAAAALTRAVNASGVSVVVGDAVELSEHIAAGSVFFLYCPFGGDRLQRVMRQMKAVARTRQIRVCCLDLPLPSCDWLVAMPVPRPDLAVYRSVCGSAA